MRPLLAIVLAALLLAPAASAEPIPDDQEARPAPEPGELAFVFTAGGSTWMRISDIDENQIPPPHGRPHLHESEGAITAIAMLDPEQTPRRLRAWKGRRVVVDGRCSATVTGLAVVSRLVGDPGYAPDGADDQWTAVSAFRNGRQMIAARLDGCAGSWARDAERSPVALPQSLKAARAVKAARADLLASAPAAEVAAEWRDAGLDGDWRTRAAITGRAVRHPTTGVTWVFVHARLDGGCGDPEASFAGWYQVGDDGALTRVAVQSLPVHTVDQLVDLDGDGRFELLGKDSLGLDTILVDADGRAIDSLELPFYGCPC